MKRRKGTLTLTLIRRLLVGLAILEFALPMFLAPAPMAPPSGLEGPTSSSSARLRFRLFTAGPLAPQADESYPTESTDQDLETDEVPKNTHERSGSSLRHVLRSSRRRPACNLGVGKPGRSNVSRAGGAVRNGGAGSWPVTSPFELAVGLPVRLGRLTC